MAQKSDKINSNNLFLMAKRVGDLAYKPLLCNTTMNTTRAVSTLDNSSKCGEDISPDKETSKVNFVGFMLNGSITDVMNTSDIEGMFTSEDTVDFMVVPMSGLNSGGLPAYKFTGFFTSDQNQLDVNTKGKTTLTIDTTFIDTGIMAPNGQIYWDNVLKNMGYLPDWYLFQSALGTMPYTYTSTATLLLAPGISQLGKIAAITNTGGIEEFTFSRAGTATYIDKNGLLQTAVNDMPRIDYSGGSARYLIEAAATNLFPFSEDFTTWDIGGAPTIKGGSAFINASKSLSTNIASAGDLYKSAPVTAGKAYTASFFFKSTAGHRAEIYLDNAGIASAQNVVFNLASGEVVSASPEVTAYGCVPCVGGWWRCYVSFVASASSFVAVHAIYVNGDFDFIGAQLENSPVLSSYIRTAGAVATRAADSLVSPANIFNPTLASFYVDGKFKPLINTTSFILYASSNLLYTAAGKMTVDDGVNTAALTSIKDTAVVAFGTTLDIYSGTDHGTAPFKGTIGNAINLTIGSSNMIVNLGVLAIFNRALTATEAQTITT